MNLIDNTHKQGGRSLISRGFSNFDWNTIVDEFILNFRAEGKHTAYTMDERKNERAAAFLLDALQLIRAILVLVS